MTSNTAFAKYIINGWFQLYNDVVDILYTMQKHAVLFCVVILALVISDVLGVSEIDLLNAIKDRKLK